MRKLMYSLLMAGIALSASTRIARADDKAKDALEDRVHTVNSLAVKKGDYRAALKDVSTETGVPMEQLQRMHDQHPDAGVGGIMVASVMADDTKKSPEQFLTHHAEGKNWAAIARDNNVPIDHINGRLDKLERDLKALPATGVDRNNVYRF